MGLLSKLFGGKSKESEAIPITVGECIHAVLVPRWESVQDMGKEDKITRYMCEACHQEFPPDVAHHLRDTINERMDASLMEIKAAAQTEEPSNT
jgi:hypothetical protein